MTGQATTALPKRHLEVVPEPDEPRLTLQWQCNTDEAARLAHCVLAMRAGFPVLRKLTDNIVHVPCVLVGTGFSAVELLPEIKERKARGEQIVALKGAHDWLLANGVVPDIAVAIDAQQERATCFKRPDHRVLYACASQMHPDTWQHLRGYRVVIWHTLISKVQMESPEWANELVIMGASTTGNSAVLLMHALGRRNVHLYGIDSSIRRVHWWNRWLRPKLKLDGTRVKDGATLLEVEADGKSFWSTSELVLQAQEIELMLPFIKGMSITPHGDGYAQAVIRQGKAHGWQI